METHGRYVIGQENVKMALSVAVHNHYMRLSVKERKSRQVKQVTLLMMMMMMVTRVSMYMPTVDVIPYYYYYYYYYHFCYYYYYYHYCYYYYYHYISVILQGSRSSQFRDVTVEDLIDAETSKALYAQGGYATTTASPSSSTTTTTTTPSHMSSSYTRKGRSRKHQVRDVEPVTLEKTNVMMIGPTG